MIGFLDDGPTAAKLDLAERVAKIPGATIGDVRSAAGLPELNGLNEWASGVLLNLPEWMDDEDMDIGEAESDGA